MKIFIVATINGQDIEYAHECDGYNSNGGFISVQKDGKDVAHYNLQAVKTVQVTQPEPESDKAQVQGEAKDG